MHPQGRWFIDGKDFWTLFSVVVEGGTDGFLKYPSAKEKITRDWSDADGLDVDLSRIFFNARSISLRLGIIADNEIDFWSKYEAFIAQWKQPGYHRIQLAEFGLRSFYCFYNETSDFTRVSRIDGTEKVGCKFTLSITEGEPTLSGDTFIVDEDGRFLIT